jgi:hypothetical protein
MGDQRIVCRTLGLTRKQHHYAKGSAQRDGLTAAVNTLEKKLPLEVPLFVGGKEVRELSSLETASEATVVVTT